MEFKVVLVDDDAVVLFLHQVIAKRSDLPPVTFTCQQAREALDKIANGPQQVPYLVLLDINMPGMNGWQFLDALQDRDFKQNVYVAIVTSSINSQDRIKAKEYPQFLEYLEKPLSAKDLNSLCLKMKAFIPGDK